MKCFDVCEKGNRGCEEMNCRLWIDFPIDLNCSLLSIKKHQSLDTKEIAERLKISMTRVSQIAANAIHKLEAKKSLLRVIQD